MSESIQRTVPWHVQHAFNDVLLLRTRTILKKDYTFGEQWDNILILYLDICDTTLKLYQGNHRYNSKVVSVDTTLKLYR